MKNFIPSAVKQIIHTISSAGFEAHLVGGCVRDLCLGLTPHDWDVTTSALPEEVTALFHRAHPLRFGTVAVCLDNTVVEVTTYRTESDYDDCRHPREVKFVTDLTTDLMRRDFTVNAMVMTAEGDLLDPLNGLADLKAGLIRAVGDPQARFREDALRILRAVRFAARYGYTIEPETLEAMHTCAPLCRRLSGERIVQELEKLLLCPHPEGVKMLFELNVLPPLLDLQTEEVLMPLLQAALPLIREFESDFSLRLGVLCALIGYACSRDMTGHLTLKLSNATLSRVQGFTFCFAREICPDRTEFAQLLRKTDENIIKACLKLKTLLYSLTEDPRFAQAAQALSAFEHECLAGGLTPAQLAVKGKDLLSLGIRGAAVGETLEQLFALVISDPAMNEKEKLLAYIREQLPNNQSRC